MEKSSLPIISLRAPDFGERIREACERSGFFYIRDHGINQDDIDKLFGVAGELFMDTSEEAMKQKAATQDRPGNSGYTAVAHERLDPSSSTEGDLKESFYVKRFQAKQPQQQLPSALQGHKEQLADFFESCRQCSLSVLEGFATALELPKDYFAQHHDAEHDRLRLIHYPPAPVEEFGQESGQIRAGSHSDYGSCTLLFQKDVGGLQVETTDANSGQKLWMDVSPVKGCVVCNVGDAMEFWTSGRFKSTYHRVALPRDQTQAKSRFSMAYFCQPSEDCLLTPLNQGTDPSELAEVLRRKGISDPGKPLTGGEHLRARLAATY